MSAALSDRMRTFGCRSPKSGLGFDRFGIRVTFFMVPFAARLTRSFNFAEELFFGFCDFHTCEMGISELPKREIEIEMQN